MKPRLIPELDVSSLTTSLPFYQQLLGFTLEYERPEERFAMLSLEGAYLMLEEAGGPGRRFRTTELIRPFGRGVNLQIEVSSVESLYNRVTEVGAEIVLPLEVRWYRSTDIEIGNHQFVVADPDGYLLRFFRDLGSRSFE